MYRLSVFLVFVACMGLALAQSYPLIWELTGGNPKGIGHGFNIRTMKETPEPLLDYSRYDASILVNGKRYSIPYEAFGGGVMKVQMINETTIYDKFEDFYNLKAKNWGINAGVTIYGIGVDVAYAKLKGEIKALTKNFTRAFSLGEYLWHAFDLEVDWADVPVDPDFKYDVMSLPVAYDKVKYRKFIDHYGSHVITKAAYGCRFNYTLSYDKDLKETRGSQWVQKQIGVALSYSFGNFGISIGVDFDKFKNETKIDAAFLAKSNGVTHLLGGDELLLSKGLQVWYPSCANNREVLLEKSKIIPIAELIRFDATRKNNMITALKDFAKSP